MNNPNLKFSIYSAFLLLGLLLLMVQVVSWFGSASLSHQQRISRHMDETYAQVLQINLDVQRMRQKVDRYVAAGHQPILSEIARIKNSIVDRIELAEKETDDERILNLFEKMSDHIEAFYKHFQVVVYERSKRKALVDVQLPQISASVQEQFDTIGEVPSTDGRLALSRIRNLFFQAEKSLLKYFEQPSTIHVDKMVGVLNEAKKLLDSTLLEPAIKQRLADSLEEFGKTGILAIQSTRSYLYFRNVVMAGEQTEESYYSRKLIELTTTRRNEILQEVERTSANTTRLTSTITLITLALSAAVAAWMVYRILPPIEKLTASFSRLSSGASLATIPGQDRNDEIGRMARAAKVFSDQNFRTRELLRQSECLSQELAQQAEELAVKNEELDTFAYVASHDLKSPLRGIRQLASWIEEDSAASLPGRSQEHLQKLQIRIGKMEHLLNELLEFSRVGRMEVDVEEVNLDAAMLEVTELIDNPAGVEIRWTEQLPTVVTQATPLQQVILNLVGNAVKHNHKRSQGWVQIDATLVNDNLLKVTVCDNGPGIAPENHERVFQMYQRVGQLDVAGNGMGLAIVKKQVQSIGGNISLKSALGEGACFEFTWPINNHESLMKVQLLEVASYG